MALILEDGSIVVGAVTYVSAEDVRAYASARGITVSADDAVLEPIILLAMDWFETYAFFGERVSVFQELAFPRSGLTVDGVTFDDTVIPPIVKNILCQASVDASTIDLLPSYAGSSSGDLKRRKIDALEKEFFKPDWTTRTPQLTKLTRMLAPISKGLAGGRFLTYRA